MRKKLLRLVCLAPLALLFASTALAQTTGTIIGVVTDASTGKPVEGAVVIATSAAMQGEQVVVTNKDGSYRITLLPPGQYKLMVQIASFKPAERTDIRLSPDKTLRANLSVVPEAVQLEEQVVRTGTAPVVNVGSAESGAVVSREFIANVPVARGFEGIAATAPQARLDNYGVAFQGAQSPENQYIVDGMNTTDPTYGTRAGGANGPPALLSNYIQEVDVKTGSFSAEYGRATGGILNVILKSGSNEFHGSVFSSFTPSMAFEPNGKIAGASGEAVAYSTTPGKGTYQLDYGFEVGGPILKDRLWFYGGFSPVTRKTYYTRFLRTNLVPGENVAACPAGSSPTGSAGVNGGQCQDNTTGQYLQNKIDGTDSVLNTSRTTYMWVGKLNYLLDENNTLTVEGWGTPSTRSTLNFGFVGGQTVTAPNNRIIYTDDSQLSLTGKYGGKFFNKRLIFEATGGLFRVTNDPQDKVVNGISQKNTATIEWWDPRNVADFESAPGCTSADLCPVSGYLTGGRGGFFKYDTNRYAGKASLSYLFQAAGSHTVKGGIDLERINYSISKIQTGGTYWQWRSAAVTGLTDQFRALRGFGTIANPTVVAGTGGTNNPADVAITSPSNKSQTDSFAYFVQDSWQIGNVTLNPGLRLETQTMKNLVFTDSTGFKITDNWSPRIQALWDFTGTGRGKLAATWGRFYYAMPLDMGDRAFGSEISLQYRLNATTCPGYTTTVGAGNAGAFNVSNVGYQANLCTVVPRGAPGTFRLVGAPLTPADPGLKGSYVDQFGAQIEYEVFADLSVGVGYDGRRQGYVIEDMSSNDGGSYFIGNPGRDRNIADPNSATGFSNSKFVTAQDAQTGRNLTIEFPKPERSYDGVTLKLTKGYSHQWQAQASYTYSVLRGNYPGPFRPEDNQLDPGITSEYDLASLMTNKKGLLPGDQTHVVKLFGSYTWQLGSRFSLTGSGAYTGASGNPVNALGAHPIYLSSQAFIIPRGQGGRTPFTHTLDLGAGASYVLRAPYALSFKVDVFNAVNQQKAILADEDYTFDTVVPVVGASCSSRNAAFKGNPIASLKDACPDLQFLRTVDGRLVTTNPNWGQAQRTTTAFQAPLSVRLSLGLAF